MELSALRLTQSIGYQGAGTVEYLYQPSTNTYSFLELNPRPGPRRGGDPDDQTTPKEGGTTPRQSA